MRKKSRGILRIFGVALFLASVAGFSNLLFSVPAFAANDVWTSTTSNNWGNSGSWSLGHPVYSGDGGSPDTGYMTNNITAGSTNTLNFDFTGSIYGAGNMIISNSTGGIDKFLVNQSAGSVEFSSLLIGSNAIMQISNGGSVSIYPNGGTFSGTASITSGGTLLLNNGKFVFNSDFVLNGGNIVSTNTGTFSSNGSSKSVNLSSGNVIVNSGTLWVQTDNAFNLGGMTIGNGATIQVNSGGTFILDRYVTSAWTSGPAPTNSGVIYLNGGTFTFNDDGSGQNASRKMINNGTIIGNGTLAASIGQNGSGIVIASNGVLNILGKDVNGNQASIWDNGGAYGSYKAVSGGDLKVLGSPSEQSAAAWTINSGGTLEIAGGVSLDLGYAFMPPGALAGAVQVDSGANLTLSSASSGAAYSNSTGSSFVFLGGTINTGYASNQPSIGFFNYGTAVAVTGNGTFATGANVNGGNANGFENLGTILATNNASTFTIQPGNAYYNAFSNAVGASIVVSNGATVAIQRTDNAWNLIGNGNNPADSNVVNMGDILLNNGTFTTLGGGGVTLTNYFRNVGTISVGASSTGYIAAAMNQMGTLALTNNLSVLSYGGTNAMTNSGTILLGANGAVATMIASNIGAHGNSLVNTGTIQGQGTLTLGVTNATGGANGNFVNAGTLLATNWGNASAGSLFVSVGNAFSNGGFSNTANGTIVIASNNTLTVNRSENAWAGSGNSVANFGTILMQGGSLDLAADGIVSNAASFINTGTISGWGTINSVVITTNGGEMLAIATNLTSGIGTLTASLASTTNNSSATLGVVGTNSVLNLLMPGSQNVLLNYGTVSLSGGSINFNGGTGTITNFYIVAGVGNASSFGIVNSGANASLVAQEPIQGLSNLIASVGSINTALLGANNSIGGAATLTLGTTSGGGLINSNGTIALQGGFITVTNTAGADAGITNKSGGLIYGLGTQSVSVANLSGGTLLASNGILRLGMSTANAGVLTNFNSSSTILLTNTVLQNTGTIALNGGGLVMGGSTITNDGTIIGPGNYSSGLYNAADGTVIAPNGTLALATNGATESVNNLGTFSIASASTLNVTPDWNNTSGLVNLGGGTLSGGAVTNSGTILGNGTITSTALVNGAGGTVKATNGVLAVNSTVVTQNGTMIGGTAAGTYLQVTNVTGALVNNGTIVMDGSGNLGLYALQALTNAASGTIKGAGIVRTADGVAGGGGKNFAVVNQGTILATNGTLIVDTGDAFAQGGFDNAAGATVTVANASTFGISRNTNAWVNAATNASNSGVIQLFGGTVQTYTNTGTGTAATPVADSTRVISNAIGGLITGNGSLNFNLVNMGTVNATNGTLVMAGAAQFSNGGTLAVQSGATLTTLQTAGNFQNNGQLSLFGGTFVGTNYSGALINAGTISGNGSLDTGRVSGSGGQNQNIVNAGGTMVATNGTLFVNPGDSFSSGGFSNSVNGTVIVANGATLTLNRTANAWNNIGNFGDANPRNLGTIGLQGGTFVLTSDGSTDASRFVENVAGGVISGSGTFSGSISNFNGATIRANGGTLALQGTGKFLQAGTLEVDGGATMLISNVNGLASVSNAGTINMNGGTLMAGLLTNANWVFGNGSITGDVSSGVINLSNSFLFASNGVLSASLGSFTNGVGVTMGTLSTNATLDVQMPGGITQPLINLGTLSFAGGTLLANGTSSGTISNGAGGVIVGVGNVTQTVANNGTILAADPVSGLNIFSVGLSSVNSATIGASNGAILNVVLSGGAGSTFNNNGSISMIGGTLIISNGTPGLITNNFFVSGKGTITPNIDNNGTMEATVNGGVLDVSLLGGTNIATGYLGAGTGATLQFENSSLVNLGTIGPNGAGGGTIQMASATAIITNLGTIQGINGLAFNSFVQNNNYLYATNGVVSFNAINGLGNAGTINISSGGTLQSNSSNSWSNAGTINLLGGTLRTGGFTNGANSAIFTNSSLIAGYGTIIGGGAYGQTGAGFDKSFANLGTILATNPISGTSQTLYISTGGATTGNGIENLGTMIVSSNNTLALDRGGLPVLNTGTITINNGTLASTSTITNTLGGIIQGYGTLTASIVNQSGGTIRATNGLLSMTSTVFPINQGTFEIDNNSTLTWDAINSWQNNGTISLLGGTLRTGGPTNALAGGEPFTNLNYMVGYGTIIGGGAFNTNGPGFDKAILNLGTIVADGGTLVIDTGVSTLSNGIANFGTMIVSNATDTLVLRREAETGVVTNNNFIINTGTILINGGTLTANTAITNQFLSGSLPGLIQGFGTIALTNQLVNLGTVRSTNTSMSGSGVLQFVNPSGSALQINQSGTLVVEGGSQMIFGSDTNAPLLNSGTIVMNGGTLSSGMLTNNLGATFRGFGTITSSIINSGTGLATSLSAPLYLTGSTIYNQSTGVLGAKNGRLIVDTVFTNAGTVSFINSIGTFNSTVVNQGAWISDPSTNVFLGTYTVATNGYISMASGDVYMFQSNFVNVSSLSNQYNTLNGKFVMNGQGTQQFYVAGLNLGGFASSAQPSNETFFTTGAGTFSTNSFAFNKDDSIFGFSNNFALGTLQLSDLSTTVLMDAFGTIGTNDDNVAGLYVNNLTLDPGSLLIISNNVELYFETTNGITGVGYGTLGAGDNVLLLDGSSFHQLTVVPEPSILMLFSVGTVAIVSYRRRKAKHSARR